MTEMGRPTGLVGDNVELAAEADALAEKVDEFRERLIAADMPDDLIDLWRVAAEATWNATNSIEEATDD